MAILEDEVWIGLAGNSKHYENVGYLIPREIDKWDRLRIPRGTKILVKIEDLPEQCNIKVTRICDDCDEKSFKKQPYNSILRLRKNGDGKDRCHKCGIIHANKLLKENVPNDRSFEHFVKTENKEYLLDEFSVKNNITPNKIFKSSKDKFLWDCPKCKNEYDATTGDRISGNNCPYCAGKRVLKGFNDLWETYPEIAKFLKDSKVGYEVTHGSNKYCDFICKECNFVKNTKIVTVVRHGFTCPRCSDGISYPEKFMMSVLDQINQNYTRGKIFNWSKKIKNENDVLCGNKIYDFYISSLNVIIETHGKQHYDSKNQFERSLEEEQENDRFKEKLAKENGIKHYIIIDCRKSELEFIKNNILTSKISDIIDLSNIDWLKCHEYACSSVVKDVANLWNEGIKSTYKIAEILRLDRSTVSKNYLKQAVELGWCNYDPKEQMKQSQFNTSKKIRKKVIQLTLTGDYIKEWGSAREIHKELGICYKKISSVCNGKMKSAGDFKWIFKDDYEKYVKTGVIPLHKNKKEVICLNTLQVYKTITEAGRRIGRAPQNIKSNLMGKTSSCGIDELTGEPLKWMYKDDYDEYIEEQKKELEL